MIIANRNSFIKFIQGILLEQDTTEIRIIEDRTKNKEAQKALDNGETITLLFNHKPVSFIKYDKKQDIYIEKLK